MIRILSFHGTFAHPEVLHQLSTPDVVVGRFVVALSFNYSPEKSQAQYP